MNWTIGKKIFLGFSVSIVLMLIVSVASLLAFKDMVHDINQREQGRIRSAAFDQLFALLQESEIGARGYILTGDESYLIPYQAATSRMPVLIEKLKTQLQDSPDAKQDFLEFIPLIDKKLAAQSKVIDARRDQGFEAAIAVIGTPEIKELIDQIHAKIQTLLANEDSAIQSSIVEINESDSRLLLIITLGAPISILLSILASILITRDIAIPLARLTESAKLISAGDLNSSVPSQARTDEVGSLSRSFLSMLGYLREVADRSSKIAAGDLTAEWASRSPKDEFGKSQSAMLHQLSDLIRKVQLAGAQVHTSALEIAASTQQQQATANEVARSSTGITQTSREISRSSTDLLSVAEDVSTVSEASSRLAQQGKHGLARMEILMKQILHTSSVVTTRLSVMNEKAGHINSLITTITKVADQTNLLSVNAAIEAEKAGEYGRGFAVVAAEIRRLADQTASSTLDIKRIVQDMLDSVASSVTGMDKFTDEVSLGAAEISQVGRQLDEVIVEVQSLTPNIETLHQGTRTLNQSSQQITVALSQLDEAARQTATSIRDSSRAIDQLYAATESLQHSIRRFKLPAA